MIMRQRRSIEPRPRGLQVFFQRFQTVELFEPKSCRRRCVVASGAKTIPAPKITFGRHQPLTGQKIALLSRTVLRINQSDLAQTTDQN